MKIVKEANTEIIQLIEKSKYQEAIDFLTTKMGGQPKELLALAYFRKEDYKQAAKHYEEALKEDPENTDLQEMLLLSKANAIAEVNVQVPDLHYFDRDTLLAKPIVPTEHYLPNRRRWTSPGQLHDCACYLAMGLEQSYLYLWMA